MTTEQTQAQPETRPSEVRSDALLAAAFADYWHEKWPHATRDVKILERSLHYFYGRDAFFTGHKVASSVLQKRITELEDDIDVANHGGL